MGMNIEHRKTTLGDDADIYKRTKDTVTKEELKNMPLKQRLAYFQDYYLKVCLAAAAGVVILIYFLYTVVINPSRTVLSVMFLNGSYVADTELVSDMLEDYIGMERKKDYVGVEYIDLSDYQANMSYSTKVGAAAVDIFICPYSTFAGQANMGIFADLSEFLPPELYEQVSGRIVLGQTKDTDIDGTVLSVGEELPYGIDISDSAFCRQYVAADEQVVLGVFAATKNPERTLKAIEFFLEAESGDAQPSEES